MRAKLAAIGEVININIIETSTRLAELVDNDIKFLLIKKLKYKYLLIKPTNLYIAIAKTL